MLSSGFAVFGVIEDAEILAHELLAEHSADTGRQLESLTARVAAAAPDAAPLFPLGLLGAMLPQALAYMRSMGADDAVCRSTFGDILRWVSRYETLHGDQITDADAKTSLQKAVLRHWRSGGALYDTGGVIKISQDGGICDVLYN